MTDREKEIVREYIKNGWGNKIIPFDVLGWIHCIADTAWQWLFTDTLNNVHVENNRDFSQVENVTHTGALRHL